MRLTEEMIELLTALEKQEKHSASASGKPVLGEWIENPDELIIECEHEGFIETDKTKSNAIRLTDHGREALRAISERLISADQLKLNHQVRIAFISTRNYPRFQKLSALGLSPGVPIKVKQKFPSYVIQCEETQVALEEVIVRDIFVWRE
jgi:Fe2+ transport system protein FeoA